MNVCIIGGGMVGSAMQHIFPDALVYDIDTKKKTAGKDKINKECDVSFICVPTNGTEDGSFDYKALEDTIKWINTPIIVIKSTIQPGTTERLISKYHKNIVFNPEFLREQNRFQDVENESRILIGTIDKSTFEALRDLYLTVYDHDKVDILQIPPKMAEYVKLVNNSYFASKVTFCNEIKRIIENDNIDYEDFRRIWLLEPRIGKNHTLVTKEGGFGGYCLPKDIRALIDIANNYDAKFLKNIWDRNCENRPFEFKDKEYK